MARRKSTKMSRLKNIEPAVLTQTISLGSSYVDPADPLANFYYIDINQINSLTNRRFYRQGLNNAIAGFKFFSTIQGTITVNKLPNTWVMANAWMKAFSSWTRMNNEALLETESLRPRFLDFKVFMNKNHHQNGFLNNQIPSSSVAIPPATLGEWESSKIYIPTALNASAAQTNDFELVATGASFAGAGASGFDALSLIEGYAASRLLPNVLDPNTPDDASDASGSTPQNWMSAIFNDGYVQTSEIIEELTTENNIAPYPFENDGVSIDTMYPGGANQFSGLAIHDAAFITPTTIGGSTRLKGGNFPCGLIELRWVTADGNPGTPLIQIDLIPGSHRGYLAEPMQEM